MIEQPKENIMWKSNCCDADVKTISADEHNNYWECTKCQKVCDAHNPNIISHQPKEKCNCKPDLDKEGNIYHKPECNYKSEPNEMENIESEITDIIVGGENRATKIKSLINLISQNFIPKSEVEKKIKELIIVDNEFIGIQRVSTTYNQACKDLLTSLLKK